MATSKVKRTTAALLLTAGLGGAFAACGTTGTDTPVPAPQQGHQQPQPVPEHDAPPGLSEPAPDLNERGNRVLGLGETVEYPSYTGDRSTTFSFDRVQVDPECNAAKYGQPAPPGQRDLLISVTVTTGADAQAAEELRYALTSADYAEPGTDGVSRPTGAGGCVYPADDLNQQTFGPNQTYRGSVELTVPEANGKLILNNVNAFAPTDPAGWELHY